VLLGASAAVLGAVKDSAEPAAFRSLAPMEAFWELCLPELAVVDAGEASLPFGSFAGAFLSFSRPVAAASPRPRGSAAPFGLAFGASPRSRGSTAPFRLGFGARFMGQEAFTWHN